MLNTFYDWPRCRFVLSDSFIYVSCLHCTLDSLIVYDVITSWFGWARGPSVLLETFGMLYRFVYKCIIFMLNILFFFVKIDSSGGLIVGPDQFSRSFYFELRVNFLSEWRSEHVVCLNACAAWSVAHFDSRLHKKHMRGRIRRPWQKLYIYITLTSEMIWDDTKSCII